MIGRVAKNVELRFTSKGTAVANIILAVERRYKKEGEEKPGANFYSITAWRKLAEIVTKHLVKGQLIAVSGHHDIKKSTTSDGVNIYIPVLVADAIRFYTKPASVADNTDVVANTEATAEFVGVTGTTDIFGYPIMNVPEEDVPF